MRRKKEDMGPTPEQIAVTIRNIEDDLGLAEFYCSKNCGEVGNKDNIVEITKHMVNQVTDLNLKEADLGSFLMAIYPFVKEVVNKKREELREGA